MDKENVNILTENANRFNINRNHNINGAPRKSIRQPLGSFKERSVTPFKERSITPPQHTLKGLGVDKLKEEIHDLKAANKELENYKELMDQYNDIKPIGMDDSILSLGTNYECQLTKLREELIDNDTLMTDLNDANNHIKRVETQLKSTDAHAQDLNSTINTLTDTINDKDAQIDRLEHDLKSLITTSDTHSESQRAQITKMHRDMETKSNTVQSLKRRCKELDRNQITLNKEIVKAKSAKSSLQSTLKNKKIELQSQIKQSKTMATEIKALNDTIFELKIEIQTEKKEDQQHSVEMDIMTADIVEYRQQIEELHEQLTLVQQESDLRHQQNVESNQHHEEVLDEAQHQMDGYKQEIEKLWDELSAAQNVQKHVAETRELQKLVDNATAKLTVTEEALNVAKQDKESMEVSMVKMTEDKDHTITTLRLELQTLKDAGKRRSCFFF